MTSNLEVQNLCKTYKKSDFSLKDVTFSVPKGAIMGFVGENGAGKSTTINCIYNALIKDSGSVKIFGEEVTEDTIHTRDDIGVVLDTNTFAEYLTPKNIATAMKPIYTNWDDALYKNYLEKFKLPFKKQIQTFSRGMTMKLGLAVALAHRPKLLILDEATGGLDPIVREEVLEIFLDFVQDENHSILLSSHITSDLEKIADYITFIHEGEIVLSELKDDLIYHYGIMRLKSSQFAEMNREDMIAYRKRDHQINVLVADKLAMEKKYRHTVIDDISIEDVMLMIVKGERP